MEKELKRATRDNDLIYHKDVPSQTLLPPIQPVDVSKVTTPVELLDPGRLVTGSGDPPLFGELLAYGARAAIGLFTSAIKDVI